MAQFKRPTTLDLINNGRYGNAATDTIIETLGYTTKGDGGAAQWRKTGATGLTPSQSPSQLASAKLTDANGHEWALVHQGIIEIQTVGGGDGINSDSTLVNGLFQEFLNSVDFPTGGFVVIPMTHKCRFLTDVTVIQGCGLIGRHMYLDVTDRDAWPNFGSSIMLDSTATININNGAKFGNLLVYRDGMTFPAGGLTAAEVALYAGTALTVQSAGSYIANSTILGFNVGVATSSANTPRQRWSYLNIDCTSGVKIDNDLGGSTLSSIKCQPILSNSDVDNIRAGVGFDIVNKSDWTTLIDCFTFQDTGFRVTDSNSVKLLACMADHPTDGTDTFHTGSGFVIQGNSTDNTLIQCQTASHEKGYNISTDDNRETFLNSCMSWNMNSLTGANMNVAGGNVYITGGKAGTNHAVGGKGLLVTNANSNVVLSGGFVFDGVTTAVDTPAYSSIIVSDDITYRNVTTVRNGEVLKTVASAGTLTLPNDETWFEVTGTTTIGTIVGAGWQPAKMVTLRFQSGLTVNNGNTQLAGNVNQAFTAGSTLTLRYETGNTWSEISRMIR